MPTREEILAAAEALFTGNDYKFDSDEREAIEEALDKNFKFENGQTSLSDDQMSQIQAWKNVFSSSSVKYGKDENGKYVTGKSGYTTFNLSQLSERALMQFKYPVTKENLTAVQNNIKSNASSRTVNEGAENEFETVWSAEDIFEGVKSSFAEADDLSTQSMAMRAGYILYLQEAGLRPRLDELDIDEDATWGFWGDDPTDSAVAAAQAAVFIVQEKAALQAELNQYLIAEAEAGNIDGVKELLDNGAEVDAKNENESTPLLIAADAGHLDVVKLLIDEGANINHIGLRATPLHHAAVKGHGEIVKLLLLKGADKTIKGKDGFYKDLTAEEAARKKGHTNIVALFEAHKKGELKADTPVQQTSATAPSQPEAPPAATPAPTSSGGAPAASGSSGTPAATDSSSGAQAPAASSILSTEVDMEIQAILMLLNDEAYDPGLIDGQRGPGMNKVIAAYAADHNLPEDISSDDLQDHLMKRLYTDHAFRENIRAEALRTINIHDDPQKIRAAQVYINIEYPDKKLDVKGIVDDATRAKSIELHERRDAQNRANAEAAAAEIAEAEALRKAQGEVVELTKDNAALRDDLGGVKADLYEAGDRLRQTTKRLDEMQEIVATQKPKRGIGNIVAHFNDVAPGVLDPDTINHGGRFTSRQFKDADAFHRTGADDYMPKVGDVFFYGIGGRKVGMVDRIENMKGVDHMVFKKADGSEIAISYAQIKKYGTQVVENVGIDGFGDSAALIEHARNSATEVIAKSEETRKGFSEGATATASGDKMPARDNGLTVNPNQIWRT